VLQSRDRKGVGSIISNSRMTQNAIFLCNLRQTQRRRPFMVAALL